MSEIKTAIEPAAPNGDHGVEIRYKRVNGKIYIISYKILPREAE